MDNNRYELEALEFKADPDKKYILVMRDFRMASSLDHMLKALKGVFPAQTVVLSLSKEQNLEVYEIGEGDTVKFTPPITPHIVAFIKEVLPNEVINETS